MNKSYWKIIAESLYNIIDNDLLPSMGLMYRSGCKSHTDEEVKEFLRYYKEEIMPRIKDLLELKEEQ